MSDNKMSDTESEEKWEYYCYGIDNNGDMIVAGGGMMNGNAYAVVRKEKNRYYYMEFGKCPYREYIGNEILIDLDEKRDDMFNFNIFETKND